MFDDFSKLKGEVLIEITGAVKGSERIEFKTQDGRTHALCHVQDCCETVEVEDVCGNVEDLVGWPILLAELVTNENENPEGVEPPEYQDSFTWAFYKLSTVKGSVTLRWYGESNGYYGETAAFYFEERGSK